MIINRIHLENFKSYKDTTIDLNEGISLILGSNGAGKSSILESISYVLFNKTSTNVDDLVRQSSDDEDIIKSMNVTLEFTHEGREYKVIRGRKGTKNKKAIAELFVKEDENYHMECSGVGDVTRNIEEKINIDSESFLNSVYIRQGEITKLIDDNASERKKLISKLLNIESLEKAWNDIRSVILEYESKRNINSGQLKHLDEELKQEEDLTQEISDVKESIKENQEELKTLENNLNSVVQEQSELNESRNEYNNVISQIKQNERMLEEKENNLADTKNQLTKIKEDQNELDNIRNKIKVLPTYEKIIDNKKEIETAQKELTHINKILSEYEQRQAKVKDNKDDYEKYLKITENLEEINKKVDELVKIDHENNIILNKLNDKKKEKNKKRDGISDYISDANSNFNQEFKDTNELEDYIIPEIDNTNNRIKQLEESRNKKNSLIQNNENILEKTNESLKQLEKTSDKCPICQSEISHDKHEELKNQYMDEINNCHEIINKTRDEITNINKELEDLYEYKSKLEDVPIDVIKKELEDYSDVLNEVKSLKKQLPEIDEIEEKLETEKDNKSKLESEQKNLHDAYEEYIISTRRIDELEKSYDINNLNGESSDYEDNIRNLKIETQKITQTVRIPDNLPLQIEYLNKEKDRANKLEGIIESKDNLENQEALLSEEIINYKKSLENLNYKLDNIDYSQEKEINLEAKYKEYDNKIKECSRMEGSYKSLLETNNKNLIKCREKIKELNLIQEEQNHINDYLKVLEDIRSLYSKDGIQRDLRERVRPLIEKNTLEIFSEFGFDYSDIILDEDYNITVRKNDEELKLDMLSGGEKIVIALALRLGIAKTITENTSDILILDEPTIHLDSDRRTHLIDIIRKIDVVPQMIVVTHDDEMESLSNNIIKITKENGISSCEN